MTAESTLLLGITGAMSWFLAIAVQVTFLVVIWVAVRRHRPDASPILLGAAIFELLATTCGYASSLLLPRFALGAGMPAYAAAQAISNSMLSIAHAAARALLIWGIVRLARPAEPEGRLSR